MSELDLDIVRHALGVARSNGFAEVELTLGEASFTARLAPGAPAPATAATGTQTSGTSSEPSLVPIKSTVVGYYRQSNPPLEVGQTVEKGKIAAVIVALGLANDVESSVSGEVVEVLVEPDQPVEYGQPLALVRPQ